MNIPKVEIQRPDIFCWYKLVEDLKIEDPEGGSVPVLEVIGEILNMENIPGILL
jgi:hypothetical protein